ncbi:MAG: HAD family phosphatase [Myxococcota bacterium]|nr:HAD family phosphatase [Myxococcota bacterium]
MSIAFFDLDLTLLSCNSATLWVRNELRLGNVGKGAAIRGAVWIRFYEWGFSSMERAIHQAISTLEGTLESDFADRVEVFWEERIRQDVRPGAAAALSHHRDSGDRLVLLTSSTDYMARPVSRSLQLDDHLANRLATRDGRFTGRAHLPLCYGAGKVELAERYAQEQQASLSECSFYTDSYSDLPMLEVVGNPVAVHPDPRLNREARRRGWPVVCWDEETTCPT